MELEIDPSVRRLGITVRWTVIPDVIVAPSREEVFSLLTEEVKTELKDNGVSMRDLPSHPVIRSLRKLYWDLGIDPTRTRPSSEALVRRIFRKGIPVINNVVDAGNLASAVSLIPVGLYDTERIEGDLALTLSRKGDLFRAIGSRDQEQLDEGVPVLRDERSPVHIYPHRDCMRTRITPSTGNVLAVACGARGIGRGYLDDALSRLEHYLKDMEAL